MNATKLFAVGAFTAFAIAAAPATAQLTVETTNFITNPVAFNGFEGLGAISGGDGVSSYSENGISVSYVGALSGIWSQGFTAPEGQYSWYPDGGGEGYTQITFAAANQIQFQASSGFFDGTPSLAYEVLLAGVSIGTGIAGALPAYGNGNTFVTYGFSGAFFDEVRLQGIIGTSFSPGQLDAGAFDAITIGGAVPEPATWAMMIVGFGAIGGAMRRRNKVAMRVTFA